MKSFLKFPIILVIGIFCGCNTEIQNKNNSIERPNILWIVIEDISAHISAYGEVSIETPNIDQLAKEGTLFEKAYVTGPVCSTARSALITGMYQTTIGAHHHRSGRGEEKIHLQDHVKIIPAMMQEAGYWTSNGNWPSYEGGPISKTDFNFEWDLSIYDDSDWAGRAKDQPFFHQIHLQGGKMRDVPAWLDEVYETIDDPTLPEEVTLPPYYTEHPDILQDWAYYLDSIRYTDMQIGQIVERLEDEGILDETVVFLISDHGVSHVRGKQFLYEEGVHIPFIVRGPGIEKKMRRDDLIVHIDMGASTLAMGGIKVPEYMQGVDLFADDYQMREWVILARDRTDETVDRIRGLRSERYKYLRNFYPDRPYLLPNVYKDNKPTVKAMREWYVKGKLSENQLAIMAETRPVEELYDLQKDPYELNNLAESAEYESTLRKHRLSLDHWMETTNDHGEESEVSYDSEMQVYLSRLEQHNPERAEQVRKNITKMKQWSAKGK